MNKTGQVNKWTSGQVGALIEEEDYLEKNLLLLCEKLTSAWTQLHRIGFEEKQLSAVLHSWHADGLDLNDLNESLNRAEFALENNALDAENPLNYIYKSLMRGIFAKPRGYKSPAERFREEKIKELEHEKAEMEKLKTLAFECMMQKPGSELYKACLNAIPDMFRSKEKNGGRAFEAAMRQAFDKISNEA